MTAHRSVADSTYVLTRLLMVSQLRTLVHDCLMTVHLSIVDSTSLSARLEMVSQQAEATDSYLNFLSSHLLMFSQQVSLILHGCSVIVHPSIEDSTYGSARLLQVFQPLSLTLHDNSETAHRSVADSISL